jgi:hypothetical protein
VPFYALNTKSTPKRSEVLPPHTITDVQDQMFQNLDAFFEKENFGEKLRDFG